MKSFIAVVSVSVLLALVLMSNSKPKVELTAAERMYSAITAYADTFNVPLHIAFNVGLKQPVQYNSQLSSSNLNTVIV